MPPRPSEENSAPRVGPLRKVWRFVRRLNITFWIILFLVLGILLGYLAPEFSSHLNPISNIFIYMVKCLVVPLIFSTLTVGIAGHGADLKKIGLMAIRAFVYFEIATTIALAVGLVAINIVKPGAGVDLNAFSTDNTTQVAKKDITWETELYGIIPESFFKAAAENVILQIVFCSIMFSVAMIKVKNDKYTGPVLAFLDGLSHIMFKVTGLVMNFAPFGVLASMAVTVSKSGLGVLVNLGKLVGTLYVALLAFMLLVFVPLLLILKVPVREFARAVARPALITFSTSSSEAALPIAMENMEKFGVPKQIVAFVIPTGYSFNLDGSTLYLAVASIFVAQAAERSLSVGDQLMMMLTLMLTSKGVAAVPRGAIVVLAAALNSFNLPQQAISVILGVDQLMNMARAGVNVIGNCLSCVVVAKWQGEFRQPGWELALAHDEEVAEQYNEYDPEKQEVSSH
ncbi:Sodium:dicarboxylate symporter [Basidiobolus meristosporus CBS 931.73]|uniref:Amino acid transporter n=1 Tax=Basidiobolus meristosporus CBS 931.73 TaxID=1314790 RepID=A0A1Y1X981_9FUNG|nr:Sodium:dicarboxylate symporter [Basidiobolus meristosporus CBS 931.73]|eukprot:ORX82310.1 Sodium:dicarboxylate symporter [Basidiobolus meristosporus CBS 931.73]